MSEQPKLLNKFKSTPVPTYYDILGVSCTCSEDAIRLAYKTLALRWHPDKNIYDRDVAEVRFKWVAEAYQVLSHPKLRQRYDLQLKQEGSTLSRPSSGVQSRPRDSSASPYRRPGPWSESGWGGEDVYPSGTKHFHLRTTIRLSELVEQTSAFTFPSEDFPTPHSPRTLFRLFFQETDFGQKEMQKVEKVLQESGIYLPKSASRMLFDSKVPSNVKGKDSEDKENEQKNLHSPVVRVKVRARYGSSDPTSKDSTEGVQWQEWSDWQPLPEDSHSRVGGESQRNPLPEEERFTFGKRDLLPSIPTLTQAGHPELAIAASIRTSGGYSQVPSYTNRYVSTEPVSTGRKYFLQEMEKFRQKQQQQQQQQRPPSSSRSSTSAASITPTFSSSPESWKSSPSTTPSMVAPATSIREQTLQAYREKKLAWVKQQDYRTSTAQRSEITLRYQAQLQALSSDALQGYYSTTTHSNSASPSPL